MIKISILIPIYNEENTIIYLLKSLQKEISKIQSVTFEIIVIDDCSKDNSSKITGIILNLFNFSFKTATVSKRSSLRSSIFLR